jgi:hypothetical protein
MRSRDVLTDRTAVRLDEPATDAVVRAGVVATHENRRAGVDRTRDGA